MQSTAWYITTDLVWSARRVDPAPDMPSLTALIERTALRLADRREGLVLLDSTPWRRFGLAEAPVDGRQPALDALSAAGWSHTKHSRQISIYRQTKDRPTVHLAHLPALLEGGTRTFPFSWMHAWPQDMLAALEQWQAYTGTAWAAGPPVMGVELMIRHLPAVRLPDNTGRIRTRAVDRRDDATPDHASEPPWSPTLWTNPQLGAYLHGYDRRRAGLTAAGTAKLAATRLTRGWRKFDRSRAGWWLISVPPWNDPNMPHPAGPHKVWDRAWVTTPTMELIWDLAEQGRIDTPEVIESLTAPGRPILQPWAKHLEGAYQLAAAPTPEDQGVRAAIAETSRAGLGMLAKHDGKAQLWRPDWYHTVNAVKRANGWRKAWHIGQAEGRWPVFVDDDRWDYVSDLADPQLAAPHALDLRADVPGGYRPKLTKELTK